MTTKYQSTYRLCVRDGPGKRYILPKDSHWDDPNVLAMEAENIESGGGTCWVEEFDSANGWTPIE